MLGLLNVQSCNLNISALVGGQTMSLHYNQEKPMHLHILTINLIWFKSDDYIYIYKYTLLALYHMKTLKLKFFYRSETLNCGYIKTTYLIEMKLTGLIEWVNEDLYTNFQSILNFHKNLIIFNFKVYRGLLWPLY